MAAPTPRERLLLDVACAGTSTHWEHVTERDGRELLMFYRDDWKIGFDWFELRAELYRQGMEAALPALIRLIDDWFASTQKAYETGRLRRTPFSPFSVVIDKR